MRRGKSLGRTAIFAGLAIFASCTQSPLSEDPVDERGMQIHGRVDLRDEDNKDVYVWLEGLDLSTRTDAEGDFTLSMPRQASGAATEGLTGMYKLYFYVANYDLVSVDIMIKEGQFAYGAAGVGPDGELSEEVTLEKILDIFTIVLPSRANNDYLGHIDVQVTLRATIDSVTVIYPKSVGGLLGAVLFRDLSTGQVFIDIPDVGAQTMDAELITTQPRSRRMIFHLNGINYRNLFLPVGQYEVIPYFFVQHRDFPPGLRESFGEADRLGRDFLKIPFRRTGGIFSVVDI